MSEKWTPVPWVLERHDHHSFTLDVVGGEGSAIGEVYIDWDGEEEGTANAHLIHAAPDLYDALRVIENALPDSPYKEIVRAALKKARGES